MRQRRQNKAQGRRRAAKNLLVCHVQKKIMMAEKVCPEDRNIDWSQVKKPLRKTEMEALESLKQLKESLS